MKLFACRAAPSPRLLQLVLLAVVWPARVLAHSNGSGTEGCAGCHNGGKTPTVLITPDMMSVAPGQTLTLNVSVSTANGNGAGFYLKASTGKLSVVDSGTKVAGNGVTQNATRTSAGDAITFKVAWIAPDEPGGVDFSAWGNSVNGDRSSRGDGEGTAFYSLAFGCAGTKFYHDFDGDGVGAETSGYTMACSVPQYYSAKLGDCDDNDPKIFAGNVEVCDAKDNNCDGQIDEGLAVTSYCTDVDSDGHGVTGKATKSGCGVSKGFGSCDNDCDDTDPFVYPGAIELCNNKDDNCDKRIDENARMICGVGWCARNAPGCTSECTPGAPRPEECNDFDDDCDGVKDNGTDLTLCGNAGFVCKEGYCVGNGAGGTTTSSSGGGGDETGGAHASNGGSSPLPALGGNPNDGVPAESRSSSGCNLGGAIPRAAFSLTITQAALLMLLRRRRRAQRSEPKASRVRTR